MPCLLLFWNTGSRLWACVVVAYRLNSVAPRLPSIGLIVVAHGLSCSMACGIFADQGSNPCLLHWQVNSLPLSHHGSPAQHSIEEAGVQSPEFINGRASFIDSQAYELSIAPCISCLESTLWTQGIGIINEGQLLPYSVCPLISTMAWLICSLIK